MEFIQQILNRAGRIEVQDDQLVRGFEIEKQDQVIGDLPDKLKGLYFILRESNAKLQKKQQEAREKLAVLAAQVLLEERSGDLDEMLNQLKQEILVDADNNRTIECLFWSSVRRVFPQLLNYKMMGIRKGWKVVAFKPNEPKEAGVVIVELDVPKGPQSPEKMFSAS